MLKAGIVEIDVDVDETKPKPTMRKLSQSKMRRSPSMKSLNNSVLSADNIPDSIGPKIRVAKKSNNLQDHGKEKVTLF